MTSILKKNFWVDRDPNRNSSSIIKYELMIKEQFLLSKGPLSSYLGYIYKELDPYFLSEHLEKVSASQAPTMILPYVRMQNNRLSLFASQVEYLGNGNKMHSIMQNHLMSRVRNVIASEVVCITDKYRCFIDYILLSKTGKVIIADFKPNAIKEKPEKVCTQLYIDKLCLSNCAGISLENIDCYYFDKFMTVKLDI